MFEGTITPHPSLLPGSPMNADTSSLPVISPPLVAMMYDDFDLEHASTRRMLERFPDAQRDWRPHEHSQTISQLATHIADIPNRGVSILTTDSMDVASRKPIATLGTAAELLAMHDVSVDAQKRALADADPSELLQEWTVVRGDQVIIRGQKYALLRRLMMSHLIHHRAQLSVYYRMLGVPVPGMYGPSADDLAGRK
jgi:uncharacterized damage-inducible protein DinB